MLSLLRALIHLGCAAPLAWLAWAIFSENDTALLWLGADPIKELEHFLGYGAIVIFCAMFVLGIILQAINQNQYQILRRALGLWAFAWAALHVSSYAFLELDLDLSLLASELVSRPYLILGMIAFSILLIMAITSLPQLKRALGKRWFSLHQLAYIAIVCAAVHYYWSVKSLTLESIVICCVVALIVAWKFWERVWLAKVKSAG